MCCSMGKTIPDLSILLFPIVLCIGVRYCGLSIFILTCLSLMSLLSSCLGNHVGESYFMSV